MKALLTTDALLLGAVVLAAVVSILRGRAIGVAVRAFLVRSLLLFGAALLVLCPAEGWITAGWLLTAVCALCLFGGLVRKRTPAGEKGRDRKRCRIPAPLRKPPAPPPASPPAS